MHARAVRVGPTRQDSEDHEAAGHVPFWAGLAGPERSDAHLTWRSSASTTTTTGIDCGNLEDKVTLDEKEARPSPIFGHEVVNHAGDDW